ERPPRKERPRRALRPRRRCAFSTLLSARFWPPGARIPRADALITALGLGILDGAGATAAKAGALQSTPSPIAIAAILNFMKCNSPLLSHIRRRRLPAAICDDG